MEVVIRKCNKHGINEPHWIKPRKVGSPKLECKKCSVDYTRRKRRERKKILVAENGGMCSMCGYDRCISALHFHHTDKSQKKSGLAQMHSGNMIALRAEVAKCILVCANCHTELEEQERLSANDDPL